VGGSSIHSIQMHSLGGNADSKLPVSEIVPLPESPAAVPYPGGDRAGGAGLIGLALFVMARAAVE